MKLFEKTNSREIIKCPLCRQSYIKNYFRWLVLEVDFIKRIKEKKRELQYKILFYEDLIESNQKKLDKYIEELSIYD
jgi:hypothetical protein